MVVTNNDPADFAPLTSFFDVILTDVPCSGEGMFRKDPVAVSEWSPENVDVCWQRQRRILSDIWPCLKPGGLLVYSTCTYNTKEDEENIRWMRDTFGAEILPLDIPADWNITGNLLAGEDFSVYRFLPHRTRGEGFFLALLRKPEQEEEGLEENFQPSRRKSATSCGKKKQASAISKEQLAFVRRWLLSPDDYELSVVGTSVTAFPKAYLSELSSLQQSLRVIQSGVSLAEAKGKDLIPHHALAMSCLLCTDAFSREEVAYEQAIAYLRKEAIVLSAAAPPRLCVAYLQGCSPWLCENIGNRANNLYPQEWRIRSGYLPEEVILPLV